MGTEPTLIVASFVFGPFGGRRMVLPCGPVPWPKFVIPDWDSLMIEVVYLRSGQLDDTTWSYLWDDSNTLGGSITV